MAVRWMWSESPPVAGDRLVFTPGAWNAGMVAVDKATGGAGAAGRLLERMLP